MLCPVCKIALLMTERQGVEIDYCSQCRGVWLDRSELDRIIERSTSESAAPVTANPAPRGPSQSTGRDYSRDERGRDDGRRETSGSYAHGRKYRKKSLLGELFDFD